MPAGPSRSRRTPRRRGPARTPRRARRHRGGVRPRPPSGAAPGPVLHPAPRPTDPRGGGGAAGGIPIAPDRHAAPGRVPAPGPRRARGGRLPSPVRAPAPPRAGLAPGSRPAAPPGPGGRPGRAGPRRTGPGPRGGVRRLRPADAGLPAPRQRAGAPLRPADHGRLPMAVRRRRLPAGHGVRPARLRPPGPGRARLRRAGRLRGGRAEVLPVHPPRVRPHGLPRPGRELPFPLRPRGGGGRGVVPEPRLPLGGPDRGAVRGGLRLRVRLRVPAAQDPPRPIPGLPPGRAGVPAAGAGHRPRLAVAGVPRRAAGPARCPPHPGALAAAAGGHGPQAPRRRRRRAAGRAAGARGGLPAGGGVRRGPACPARGRHRRSGGVRAAAAGGAPPAPPGVAAGRGRALRVPRGPHDPVPARAGGRRGAHGPAAWSPAGRLSTPRGPSAPRPRCAGGCRRPATGTSPERTPRPAPAGPRGRRRCGPPPARGP